MRRRILLIEDDPDDARLTCNRLAGDCDIVTANSAKQAKSLLQKDKNFDQILYDYGAGGTTEEEKLNSQQQISRFCQKYGISMVVLSSAKVSSETIASIESRGASFQTKEVLRSNKDTLMTALGWNYLESQEHRNEKRSQIVRELERTIAKQDYLISEMQSRVGELAHTVVSLSSRLLVLERLMNDFAPQLEDLEREQKNRMEDLEKTFTGWSHELRHKTSLQVAKWGAIGAIFAAIVAAIGAFIVAKK